MSTLHGFGFVVTAGGWPRYWYIDPHGVKRWADTDEAITAGNGKGA